MASPKFKLGQLVPKPTRFNPTRVVTDRRWVYRIDSVAKVVRRQPRFHDDPDPAGYFQIVLAQPLTSRWRTLQQSLKRGIVVPSLATVMLAGLFLILYPLYPGIKFQVQQQLANFSNSTTAVAAPDPNHNRLVIPKIGVDTTILEGSSLAVLKKHDGVWHQKGRIADDNFVLSGHRFKYLPPNTSTLYNLSQIAVGDTILVDWYGTRHIYTVTQTKRINQNDTSVLNPTTSSQITIYTCYDKRQTERIVVIAQPQP